MSLACLPALIVQRWASGHGQLNLVALLRLPGRPAGSLPTWPERTFGFSGYHYDDTKRYVNATEFLTADERYQVFEGNARRVFPRLDKLLKERGL